MQLFDLVIGPVIVVGAFALGIFLIALRWTNARIRADRARQRAAMLPSCLIEQQSRAIIDTINELELNQVSYAGVFPEKLKEELMAAHEAWTESTRRERKGIYH